MPTYTEVICDHCNQPTLKLTKYVNENIKLKQKTFCSRECRNLSKKTKVPAKCGSCGTTFDVFPSVLSASKSGEVFCSKSCSATYNNTHKTRGYRRSKLETFIENRLIQDYPTLDFLFNDRSAVGLELDVYCPSLRIAIEVNGIVHYEPIYGNDTFIKTQERDNRKMLVCADQGIELIVINASSHSYVTDKTCNVFYQSVKNILDNIIHRV